GYVEQDYVFLIDYGRLLALGAAKAPDLPTMRRFADLTQAILVTEMDLHRSFAAEWGIGEQALEATEPTPATAAYVDFLLRTAALGDFAELVAVLLPCMWSYAEIGERLAAAAAAGQADPGPYADWVATYASAEFAELADWCRALTAQLAADADGPTRERMTRAFLGASRHELAFWESCWVGDSTPPAA
ncbi:MAG: thiaminase II, partial [Solirubrobacteraceae bacterium]|nr:thiaminase II [Solirubrobacteraceae bacterium]